MNKIESALYRAGDGRPELLVTRLQPQQLRYYAQPILRILGVAYERQLEDDFAMLEPGTARRHFNHLSSHRVQEQADRMTRSTINGSVYWVAQRSRYVRGPGDIIGMAKLTPSRPGWRTRLGITPQSMDNCYINDIAVTEPRIGVGSALLHTALTDYGVRRTVVTDVLPGAEPFFRNAGMGATGYCPESLRVGSVDIMMERFQAYGAGAVRRTLEQNHAWLADGDAFSS